MKNSNSTRRLPPHVSDSFSIRPRLSPKNGAFDYLGDVKPSDIGLTNSPMMGKKMKTPKIQSRYHSK